MYTGKGGVSKRGGRVWPEAFIYCFIEVILSFFYSRTYKGVGGPKVRLV